MKGLEAAAKRICTALIRGEKVTIFGDYDVDGTVSCALLSRFLGEYGFKPEIYIPNRMTEGYGLNSVSVERVYAQGTQVIVTVDNGISAIDACAVAKRLGIDVIVTDHHCAPQVLPDAFAIVNPKQQGCLFPYKDLAGVGVAFYLAIAMRQQFEGTHPGIRPNLRSYLDFVSIGTIADLCPLHGLNHLFTRLGLQALAENVKLGKRLGIERLARVSGISDAHEITSEHVAFQLGPRLNAAGRLGTAMKTAALLTTDLQQNADELAHSLDSENKERRSLEKETFAEIQALIFEQWPNIAVGHHPEESTHSLVIAGEDWHPGILGIVASRCVEKFYKPTLILTKAEGVLKGSGRSTDEINLFDILDKHRSMFLSFGGHSKAVGFSLERSKVDWLQKVLETEVKEALQALSEITPGHTFKGPLKIDGLIALHEINFDLVEKLESLEPFGFGNHRPRFAIKNVVVEKCTAIGKNTSDGHCHVELREETPQSSFQEQSRGFSRSKRFTAFSMRPGLEDAHLRKTPLNVAVEISEGHWNGNKKLELRICDFGPINQ